MVAVEGSASTIATPGGKLLCIVVRDITQRAQAEADLAEARRGLAVSREQERVRLARELHDGAVQELAALRYQLAAARGRIRDSAVDGVDEQIKAVERDVAKVIGQMRGLIAELRPTGLDDKGLGVALGNYVGDLAGEATGCRPEITLDVSPEVANLPTSIALCLFRVTQEALRNAVHHGHPRQVIVRLRVRSRDVILRVRDDGCGFAVPVYLSALTQAEHYGLVGIAERVAQVNGRLRIRSRAGEGTIVTVWLPLSIDERGQNGDDAHPLG